MTTSARKKHPCPDCRQCQGCSPSRCHLCRGQGGCQAEARFAGLSLAEQIALYEELNQPRPAPGSGPRLERRPLDPS